MKISLSGLCATGFHGVLPEERRNGQQFVVDILLNVKQPVGDQLGETVDYGDVAKTVEASITGQPVNLIETLCARIADSILAKWPAVRSVKVTVHKPQAPIPVPFGDVSCTLVRRRQKIAQQCTFALSLGANLGDTIATLRGAVATLRHTPGIMVTAVSDVYRSAPVDVDDTQPDYFNLVVIGNTTLAPLEILGLTSAIETRFGRQRPYPHAPRTLDIDLLDVGHLAVHLPELTLPHPRAHQRGFVLVPWAQIEPDAHLPQGRVCDLAEQFDSAGITRVVTLG